MPAFRHLPRRERERQRGRRRAAAGRTKERTFLRANLIRSAAAAAEEPRLRTNSKLCLPLNPSAAAAREEDGRRGRCIPGATEIVRFEFK